jgi:SPP1 gp7 family putative phage head morphogenesis protein
MEKLIQKSLEDQWNDLIISGLIKTLFDNYPKFFVNRPGIKTKLKKNFKKQEEEDSSEEDEVIDSEVKLRGLATDNLQEDKISVTVRALKMKTLLTFLWAQTHFRSRSVTRYNNFNSNMKGYLKNMSNKGGQDIISQIVTPKPLKFRLSKRDLVNQIKRRTITLARGIDATTRNKFVNQLAIGIRKGERKSDMIKRLQRVGKDISKERARKIVMTETVAVSEWMRGQTAAMNGGMVKVWRTADDERVCPVCEPLDGKIISSSSNFSSESFSGGEPPAHALCRCTVEYEFRDCAELAKSHKLSIFDKITRLFHKANGAPSYDTSTAGASRCQNPEAVWAGGESIVGSDKEIGNIFNEVKDLRGVDRTVELARAGSRLTEEGYVQLRTQLGLKGGVDLEEIDRLRQLAIADPKSFENALDAYKDNLEEIKSLGLKRDEFVAIRGYSEALYADVNRNLRLDSDSRVLDAYIGPLDSALNKMPAYKGTVYRGMNMPETLFRDIRPGSILKDRGYMSTSSSAALARGFMSTTQAEIKKGVPVFFKIESFSGRDISSISKIGEKEKEILMPRGTSLKINKVIEVPFTSKEGEKVTAYGIIAEEKKEKARRRLIMSSFERALQRGDNLRLKLQREAKRK